MAKVKGIFGLSGTLDGINFYVRNGEQIARKAGGGFTSKAIKTKPSMEKVRKNGSEFGAVTTFVKHFKLSFAAMLFSLKFPEMHVSLIKLFVAIKNLDTVATHGTRSVSGGLETDAGKELLTGFCVPPFHSSHAMLYKQISFDRASKQFQLDYLVDLFKRLPKGVDVVAVQVCIVDYSSGDNKTHLAGSALHNFDVSAADSYATTISIAEDLPEKGIALISLCYYERRTAGLQVMTSKNSFYLEVLSVWS